MSEYIVNSEITENFSVNDSNGNLISGIDTSTFTWDLYDPNSIDTSGILSLFISELGNGSYRIKFTPDIVGSWYLSIYNSEYFPWGKSESFWIIDDTSLTISEIINGIEKPGGKLDAIYEKLPDNQIADSQDSTSILNIVNDIDNKSDIINNKIDNLSIDCTNLDYKIDILNIKCNEISNDLKRVLGLVHENIFIDLPNYDVDNNLISARLRIYSNSFDVGTINNIIGSYLIESDSSGTGKFNNWKQTKI